MNSLELLDPLLSVVRFALQNDEGARYADTRGRKRIGVPLGALSVVAYVGFLVTGGIAIWPFAAAANALGSAAGVALIVYGPELLPTRVRAAGNNAILAMSVTGLSTRFGKVDWEWRKNKMTVRLRGWKCAVKLGPAFKSDTPLKVKD